MSTQSDSNHVRWQELRAIMARSRAQCERRLAERLLQAGLPGDAHDSDILYDHGFCDALNYCDHLLDIVDRAGTLIEPLGFYHEGIALDADHQAP